MLDLIKFLIQKLRQLKDYFMMSKIIDKKQKTKIAVAIMPWAGLHEAIKVGPVKFWPWDSSKIHDEDVRNQLGRFFKIFVDHYSKTVNTITICSHGKPDFHILEEEEYNELRAAINILVFSAICPDVKRGVCSNNNSIAPPTAERYDFFGQKFKIPNDRFVVVSTRSSMNFEDIDKVHISRPWGVSGPWGSAPNMELLGAFDKVFDNSFPSEVRERFFRSLEWFRLAHTEGNNVSDPSRLVMMATAFEILLDFPDYQKSKYFADQIDGKLRNDKSIIEIREYQGKPVDYSRAACWAWDFYQLRNQIVHGDNIKPEDGQYKDWITYNIVADLVFWELVKRELYERDCLGDRARKWAKKFKSVTADPAEVLEKFFVRWTMGFDDYHRALGWIKANERLGQDG